MVQAVLGIVLLLGALAMVHYYLPTTAQGRAPYRSPKQVHELTAQVEQLQQDQAMPAVVLNRYRNSIGYIYGVYQVGFPTSVRWFAPAFPAQDSWSAKSLVATNRHVAEPWYGDSEAQKLIDHGATGMLESLVIFFPGSPTPVNYCPHRFQKLPISPFCILKIPQKPTPSAVSPFCPLPNRPALPDSWSP
jgi:hypothetical protein